MCLSLCGDSGVCVCVCVCARVCVCMCMYVCVYLPVCGYICVFVCAASTDMKKKLYGSVLVVGGGFAFHGVAAMLQATLYTQLPAIFQKPLDAIEVSSNPRVGVSRLTCTHSYGV